MTYRLLASNGCQDGPCPTFYIDDATGDVIVQGYRTRERPVHRPWKENFVRIPAADWRALLADLSRA